MMRIIVSLLLALGIVFVSCDDVFAWHDRNDARHEAEARYRDSKRGGKWYSTWSARHDGRSRYWEKRFGNPWRNAKQRYEGHMRFLQKKYGTPRESLSVRQQLELQNLHDSYRYGNAPSFEPKGPAWDSFCRFEAKNGRTCTPARFKNYQVKRYSQ